MNAYKCDICGKYFEDHEAKTGSIYSHSAIDIGHNTIKLKLNVNQGNDWSLFNGDMCPDCMGYFCVGLVERGCQSDNIKMYAADHIKKVREEMGIEEEVTEDGPTE